MLDRIQVISDPTRFAILGLLKENEYSAGEIARHFADKMSRPAISQHLRILKDHSLIWERRKGTKRLYRLRTKGMYDLYRFLEKFWEEREQEAAREYKSA